MEIWPEIEIVGSHAALHLREHNAICIADLHLGYEEGLVEEGITLPTTQFIQIRKDLEDVCRLCDAGKLIINGDLRHVFARSTKQEWREVPMFIDFALTEFDEIVLIRGNHDTMLGPLRKFEPKVKILDHLKLGDLLLIHGHKEIEYEGPMIIAHEHPMLALGDKIGARIKVPAFLSGRNLIVMPAFTPLAGGTDVNLTPREELLSPILQRTDVEEMEAYAIDREAGVLKFPRLGDWREFSLRL